MKRIVFVFAASLSLAGCGAAPSPVPQTLVVTRTIYVPWTVPAYLTQCAPDVPPVPVPHIPATDLHGGSKAAKYVLALQGHDAAQIGVADDCRNTIAAIVRAASQPKEVQ